MPLRCNPSLLKRLQRNQGQLPRRYFLGSYEEVENSGSIARDILATERTFLAWARTGLGFVGAGSALFAAYHRKASENIDSLDAEYDTIWSRIVPACGLLIGNGAFLLVFATRRYLTVISALRNNQFVIDIRGTLTAVGCTAVSSIMSLGLMASAELEKPKPIVGETKR